ncbi:MAG: hypothetical protein AB1515_08740 [Nitrospirota bacterium]
MRRLLYSALVLSHYRRGIRWIILPVLAAACSTTGPTVNDDRRAAFDRNAVALIRTFSADEAGRIRQALLRGEPFPASTAIVPIGELDRIHPSLSLIATRLRDCEISEPIASNAGREGAEFVLLQRGGGRATPCHGEMPAETRSLYQRIDEWGGELLIGLLLIGLAGALAALPFLF